jgi:hypothetical protein
MDTITSFCFARSVDALAEDSDTIIKYRLLLVLGNIIEFTDVRGTIQTDSVEKLQRNLSQVRQMIPPYLQITEGQSSEPLTLKRDRVTLDRIFQLGQCLLHRGFLNRRHDPSVLQYRGSCIDAAMTLLDHQSAIFLEFGSNYAQNVKRRNRYTLTSHDFFVAGMTRALDLHYGFKVEPQSPNPSDVSI